LDDHILACFDMTRWEKENRRIFTVSIVEICFEQEAAYAQQF
jgi:hypothetical protein